MKVVSKYKLELHWSSVEYPEKSRAVLKDAYFSGRVLKNAARINNEDNLTLDMTEQHVILVPDYYQAILSWKGVEYKDDKVFLKKANIKGKYVNSIETLQDTDYIVIDCRDHEDKKHPFHLVYFAEIQKQEKERKY